MSGNSGSQGAWSGFDRLHRDDPAPTDEPAQDTADASDDPAAEPKP